MSPIWASFRVSIYPLLELVKVESVASNITGRCAMLRDSLYPELREKLEQQMAIIDRELE